MADQAVIKADDLVVTGNLKVSGSQISTTSTDTDIKDNRIVLNKGGNLDASGSGIVIESGGSNVASFVYKTSGWDLGNKNITTTGTISGTISLAADSVNDTHIDFGTGANQVSTADVPEQTNLYFTDTRADARVNAGFSAKSTADLSEGSNLYYTNARADARIAAASINTLSDVDTTGLATNKTLKWSGSAWVPGDPGHSNTDTLTEGSSNLYFTNARADARIAAASLTALSNVATVSASDDNKSLVYDHSSTSFIWRAPAVAVANYSITKVASKTINSLATTYAANGVVATKNLTGVNSSSKVQITFTVDIGTVNPSLSANKFAVVKAVQGDALSSGYASTFGGAGSPGTIYEGETSGYGSNVFTFTIGDESSMGNNGVVDYQIVMKSQSGTITSIGLTDIDFSATEFRANLIDTVDELADTTISGKASGHYLKWNGSAWINAFPTIADSSDVTITSASTGKVLRYNGSAWVDVDPNTVASNINLTSLTDVGTVGATDDGKLLKYDHSSTSFVWTSGLDVITEVVDDTTPQLGGDLDVNGNAITSVGATDINITPATGRTVIVNGDLTVTGTATTLDVQNMTVEDQLISLNKWDSDPTNNTNDIGIVMWRGSADESGPKGDNVAMIWDESEDKFTFGYTAATGAETGAITLTDMANIRANIATLTATAAQYADLAEIYKPDSSYEPGTVLVFGGEHEVTTTTVLADHRVAGVVSSNPAYLMNKDAEGVAVALRGKVPCKVEGTVKKGDVLVTNARSGTATALAPESANPPAWCIVGKSLEDSNDAGVKVINIVV
tara:strand:- start:2602 stop:4986 length:2385 start_codon:yes stop_codon:yes gene_type:complete